MPFVFAGEIKWHANIRIPIALNVMIAIVYYGVQRVASDLLDPFGWEDNNLDLTIFGIKVETESKLIAQINPGNGETFIGQNKWKPQAFKENNRVAVLAKLQAVTSFANGIVGSSIAKDSLSPRSVSPVTGPCCTTWTVEPCSRKEQEVFVPERTRSKILPVRSN
jgi:hypothetical protein